MRPEEIIAAGDLAGEAVAGVTDRLQETHQAIARRAFDAVGPAARPVAVVHDGIATLVYRSVSTLTRFGVRFGGRAIGAAAPRDRPALETAPAGRRALAALNGVAGDLLHERQSPLELRLTLRRDGAVVGTTAGQLATAFRDATPRLALFVHGLGQTEDAWRTHGEGVPLYGSALHGQLGVTPLYVRYNTGRPVSENGAELAQLISEVVAGWPVTVRELTLVGHAAGALVCRSACDSGAEQPWISVLGHVIALGAPHRGTSIEKAARAAGSALGRLPETTAARRALERRSAGLKDSGRGDEASYLPHVNYRFVSASITRDTGHPFASGLGDLLVSRDSAWAHPGGNEPVRFSVDSYREIGGISHFELTRHPVVLAQIVAWLDGESRALAAPRRQLPPPGSSEAQRP